MEKERILFVVHYSGTFGYIKPWTAVRDGETYSQQFLTPSIVEGMEKKLFPETLSDKGIHKIARHKLSYKGIDVQQETTQTQAWKFRKKEKRVLEKHPGGISKMLRERAIYSQ